MTATVLDETLAQHTMLVSQIRTWDVFDAHVLHAMSQVPREQFVPPTLRALAFADSVLPLGDGEEMLAPRVAARLLQAVDIQPGDKVLEVGTGSGYVTACLAYLAAQVHTLEIRPELAKAAKARFAALKLGNITAKTGDVFAAGWCADGTYDVIVVTGSLPQFDPNLLACLRLGGRLFVVVGVAPVMAAQRVERLDFDAYRTTTLFETCVPPLRHAPQPSQFQF